MLHQILKQCTSEELKTMEEAEIPEEVRQNLMTKAEDELPPSQMKMQRKMLLKNKI